MKLLRKSGMKFTLFLFISITIITCIIMQIITLMQYINYQKRVNIVIGAIIGKITNKYPEVEESEIIEILDANVQNYEQGSEILNKYGINTQEVSVILELDKQVNKNIVLNILIILIYSSVALLIFIIFIKGRNKKINDIVGHIQEINRKNYSLKIYDNTEDDLSVLRNELYKITVMLKEQAFNSTKDKEAIQTAVSDISHQLKTPLTSISIMLDNITENPDMDIETKNKFIYEIRRQIDWINWLVISLLKLSKLDANAVTLKQEDILVKELVNSVEKNLAIGLEIKNQQIITQDDQTATFKGDFNWQLEALTNIVKNCIEHTPENKNIYVSWEENAFYTKITITDEGEGIQKDEIRHIFERFYRGKNSSENSIGIGLALAKSIIEKQNGFISVTSTMGEGSTFEIKYMKN